MAECKTFHMTTRQHDDYVRAVAEFKRPDQAAEQVDAVKRFDRVIQDQGCVVDAPHPPPHRDAAGHEWGWPEDEGDDA